MMSLKELSRMVNEIPVQTPKVLVVHSMDLLKLLAHPAGTGTGLIVSFYGTPVIEDKSKPLGYLKLHDASEYQPPKLEMAL